MRRPFLLILTLLVAAVSLPAGAAPEAGRRAPVHAVGGCELFPADNPWNRRIDTRPVWKDSRAIVAAQAAGHDLHLDLGTTEEYYGIPVNVVGALVWGYGVRHGWGRSAARFLALSTGVGLACTLVAAPIVLFVFGGYSLTHAEDTLTRTVVGLVGHLGLAVFASNLITSLADKVISGFIGLAVVESLPRAPERHPTPAP